MDDVKQMVNLSFEDYWVCLNRIRSAPLGEEHNSKSGADGSCGQVGGESCQNGAGVSMASGNSSPDGSESVFSFAGMGFVDVGYSLAEVVLSG
jgi:hypothetical protein